MGVGGQRHALAALTPGKTRYLLYRLIGPQSRWGRARKILPPPGFDPRTVQPVASRYTDYANEFIKCTCILSQLVAVVYKMVVNLTHALSCRQTSGPALGVSNKWLSSLIIMLLVYIL